MSSEHDRNSRRLQALERWRSAELEEAQAQYVLLERAATERAAARDRASSELEETQSFARERLAAQELLEADSMRRFAEFAAMKSKELASAQGALDDSRVLSDQAHGSVVQKFEQLSVVQRLGERRDAEAVREAARQDQKRLDEQALARLAATPVTSPTEKE
jgi:hypothetical protein